MAVPGKLEKQINTFIRKSSNNFDCKYVVLWLKSYFLSCPNPNINFSSFSKGHFFDTFLVLALSIKTLESLFVIAHLLGATKSDRQRG